MLLGVCAGFAKYFNADVTLVRVLTIVLGVFVGIIPAIIAYLLVAAVVPPCKEVEESTKGKRRRRRKK